MASACEAYGPERDDAFEFIACWVGFEFFVIGKCPIFIIACDFDVILAGLCEVAFAYCLGRAKGISGMEWYAWITAFGVFYILSAILLAKATEVLPIGTAYPVWTGIGAVGAVLIGIFIFKEPATFWRLFFLTTLILSIIGLKTIS